MIPNERRTTGLPRIMLLSGAILALAIPGCGGGGGGGGSGGAATGGTSGSGGARLDAKADTQVVPGTGGALGTPDAGVDQTSLGGVGGTTTIDAGPDAMVPGPEAGRPDTPTPDTAAPDVSPDVSPDVPQPLDSGVDRGSDAPAEVAPVDGAVADGGSPTTCQGTKLSRTYTPQQLKTIVWAKDDTLVTAGTFFPNNTTFGSKTITSEGASDMFVAGINPATGDANWVFTAGDVNDQSATQVASSSNLVAGVIGKYIGSLEILTGSPMTNPSLNPFDYVAGIDGTTGTGLWSKSVNLGTGTVGLSAIAGHPNKDYFVVCGTARNSAANLGVTGATPGGGADIAVAALKASDGSVIWAKLFGGTLDQTCKAAALDDDGNVLLAGQYAGTLDFGGGALTPAPTGTRDGILWLAKLNGLTGALITAQSFGTTGLIVPAAIAADAQGNALVSGYFQSAFTVGTTTLTPVSDSTSGDSFVINLSSSLAPMWARRWGSAGPGPNGASSYGVAYDSSGAPKVVGGFKGTIDIGPGSAVLTANAPTGLDVLVAGLDSATGATTCAHQYGDSNQYASQAAWAIAVNRWASGAGKDSVAIVGTFLNTIDFGSPTTALSAGGSTTSQAAFLLETQP